MTNEEMAAFRAIVREEVNAAAYASEQRMSVLIREEISASEQRTDERFNKLETRIELMTRDLILMKAGLREVQSDLADVKSELKEVVSVLDTATSAINELQDGQRSLDTRVIYLAQALSTRMDRHERLPIDKAHPGPGPGL
jgi:chromosome segregation ATPase